MGKDERLLNAFLEIDSASEIAYATLAAFSDRVRDEKDRWIVMGVLEQLYKIKKSAKELDNVFSGLEA